MGLTQAEFNELNDELKKVPDILERLWKGSGKHTPFIAQKIESIKNDLSELIPTIEVGEDESYPVGFDPKGDHILYVNIDGKWCVKFYQDDYYLSHHKGERFTTREQAQKKCDGLNNLKELIFAIHEENEKIDYNDENELYSFFIDSDTGSVQWDNMVSPINLMVKYEAIKIVLGKLGEPKIKSALIDGVG